MRPRLVGARFAGGSIPFEVLRDLAAFEDMLIDVARWKFLDTHRERTRSPRGFADRIALQLTGVRDGSAIIEIGLTRPLTSAPHHAAERACVEGARDAIIAGIDAAARGDDISAHIPLRTLAWFDRFGRSLRDGEAIEFPRASAPPVRLDRELRWRLVLASPATREITDEVTLRGLVPEADHQSNTFHLMLADGRRIKGPLDGNHRDPILMAFAAYSEGQRIEIKGIGRLDRSERLMSLDTVHHVNLLEPLDPGAQIDDIKLLRPGWLDGNGEVASPADLDRLIRWFATHLTGDAPLPHLYPTPEGGVQAEWTFGSHEITLNIDMPSGHAIWHALDIATNTDEERALDLWHPDTGRFVADQLRRAGESVQ